MNARVIGLYGLLTLTGLGLSGAAYQPPQGPIPPGHPPVAGAPEPGKPAPQAAQPADVESIDSIIKAFYALTSGLKGEPRQWARWQSLFSDNARLIPIHHRPHGEKALLFIPVGDYIEYNRKYLEKAGFSERELSRRVEEFGSIAHVFSTFETRRNPEDAEAYSRGIYSFQLSTDGQRWYIVNVMWDTEQPDQPLPAKYLAPSP